MFAVHMAYGLLGFARNGICKGNVQDLHVGPLHKVYMYVRTYVMYVFIYAFRYICKYARRYAEATAQQKLQW